MTTNAPSANDAAIEPSLDNIWAKPKFPTNKTLLELEGHHMVSLFVSCCCVAVPHHTHLHFQILEMIFDAIEETEVLTYETASNKVVEGANLMGWPLLHWLLVNPKCS